SCTAPLGGRHAAIGPACTGPDAVYQPSRSLMPSRSSSSSFRVWSMRSRENASISRPSTRVYSPLDVVTGTPYTMPSGMPYEPSEGTPMVTHLPFEPSTQSRMWSMAALAAEAAEDRPRASMMAAPRLPTVGMKVSRFQAWSLMTSSIFLPLTVAKRVSGYIVGEWLPHTMRFSMSATATPALAASCDRARLWSRRSMA